MTTFIEFLRYTGIYKDMRFVVDGEVIITGVMGVVFSMREGDQNNLPDLTSVHVHRYLLSVPGRPQWPFVKNERASATLGINILTGTYLDYEVMLRQSKAPLLVHGERGLLRLLVSRQLRNQRAPPVTRRNLVVPRWAWLPFQPALPKTTRRSMGVQRKS